jgi:chromosome segregation ATPase
MKFPSSLFANLSAVQVARRRVSDRLKEVRADIRDKSKAFKVRGRVSAFMQLSCSNQATTIQDLEGHVSFLEANSAKMKKEEATQKAVGLGAREEMVKTMVQIDALREHYDVDAHTASAKAGAVAEKEDQAAAFEKQLVTIYQTIYSLEDSAMTLPSMTMEEI